MIDQSVTLLLPDRLYQRLRHTALATHRTLEEIMLRALEVGEPPVWDDVPPEFQADLAALDRLDDDALWAIAGERRTADDPLVAQYNAIVQHRSEGDLSGAGEAQLDHLQYDLDLFMLRKAHAAALLRWRGRRIPSL